MSLVIIFELNKYLCTSDFVNLQNSLIIDIKYTKLLFYIFFLITIYLIFTIIYFIKVFILKLVLSKISDKFQTGLDTFILILFP